jgi:hypothetical protein
MHVSQVRSLQGQAGIDTTGCLGAFQRGAVNMNTVRGTQCAQPFNKHIKCCTIQPDAHTIAAFGFNPFQFSPQSAGTRRAVSYREQ